MPIPDLTDGDRAALVALLKETIATCCRRAFDNCGRSSPSWSRRHYGQKPLPAPKPAGEPSMMLAKKIK
jgi:hypothetical protein